MNERNQWNHKKEKKKIKCKNKIDTLIKIKEIEEK